MSTFRLAASWLLAIGLAVFFVHVTLHPWPDPVPGYVKLYDAPGENLLFAALAEGSGVTIFEPAGRFVSAIIELLVAPMPDVRGRRVLVVDDNHSSLEIFKDQLSSLSFNVTTSDSAEHGIAELEHADTPYDLVIMDWIMPGIDGFKAAQLIRNATTIPSKPKIIMTTAYDCDEVAERAYQEGLDGCIGKPANLSVLFDGIITAFGKDSTVSIKSGAIKKSASELAAIKGARALLVEDNEFNQQVARELLESAGMQITLAVNGEQALTKLRSESFDIVFMDIQMPVMDGLEATRQLRCIKALNDLPVIAMTAHAMAQDRQRCLDNGMNDYISKPIDPNVLMGMLVKWIKPRLQAAAEEESSCPQSAIDTNIALLAHLPGIDMRTGLEMCNCKPAFYHEMLVQFLSTKQNEANTIRELLAAGDRESARRSAHSMKSIAGTIGAVTLSGFSRLLEDAIADNQEAKIEKDLRGFEVSLAVVIDGLQAAFGDELARPDMAEAIENAVIDLAALRKLVDEASSLLDIDIIHAIELVDELGRYLCCTEMKMLHGDLKRQLNDFDTESARTSLGKMAEKMSDKMSALA